MRRNTRDHCQLAFLSFPLEVQRDSLDIDRFNNIVVLNEIVEGSIKDLNKHLSAELGLRPSASILAHGIGPPDSHLA